MEDGKHEGKQLSVLLPSVYGGRVEATVDDRDERCDFSLMLGDGSTRFENLPPGLCLSKMIRGLNHGGGRTQKCTWGSQYEIRDRILRLPAGHVIPFLAVEHKFAQY